MALVLPEGHPLASRVVAPRRGRAARVAILNVMPKLQEYEPLLLGPLGRAGRDVEPVFVRLESHGYGSSDQEHLARFYRPLAAALADGPLDGLVLTGAPVEEIPFAEVRYFRELVAILDFARARIASTLGLCWGGMALAHLEGVPKVVHPRKLFGVFEGTAPAPHRLLGDERRFVCAQSRHSGVDERELARAEEEGRVRRIGGSPETGTTLFESSDGRFVMHLGHPEYVAERVAFEWRRDRELGRSDVGPPAGFDPERPTEAWADHRERFFQAWIEGLAAV